MSCLSFFSFRGERLWIMKSSRSLTLNRKHSFTLYSSKDVKILHLIPKTNPVLSTSKYVPFDIFFLSLSPLVRPLALLPSFLLDRGPYPEEKRKEKKKERRLKLIMKKNGNRPNTSSMRGRRLLMKISHHLMPKGNMLRLWRS